MRYADPILPLTFWRHVEPDSTEHPGGWLWTGAVTAAGRGSVWLRDEHNVPRWWQPHVAVFVYGGGVLTPEQPVVRHECDVELCLAWDHLLAGSHADNAADRERRGRSAGTRRPRLQPEIVLAIRERRTEGTSALVAAFDLDRRTVQRILSGQTHPHLTPERI